MKVEFIVLLVIWLVFFVAVRKRINSGYVYFFFLLCMMFPKSIGSNNSEGIPSEVSILNICAFGICLVVGFIPWYVFDSKRGKNKFIVTDNQADQLKPIFRLLIIISVYSLCYLAPFAYVGISMGADDVRSALYASNSTGFLPNSIFTTIAVAGAACYIFAILFFYISCLNKRLYRYRIWLAISSLSYMANCFAITARDGLILIPCIYIVFYLVFKSSMPIRLESKINRQMKYIIVISAFFLVTFSLSRFYRTEDVSRLYSGTFGYITQQPYVFNATVEGQDDFWGFEGRFPLVNRVIGVEEYYVDRKDRQFEWSFGTMYSEFYSSFGWMGVVLFSLTMVSFYGFGLRFLYKRHKYFGFMLLFTVYLFIVISGMFYFRAGVSLTLNIFYLTLSIVPFFVKSLISKKQC